MANGADVGSGDEVLSIFAWKCSFSMVLFEIEEESVGI